MMMEEDSSSAKTISDQGQDDRKVSDQNVDVDYKIPEVSKCVVCDTRVTNVQIKILPCLHSICSNECFEKNRNEQGDKCPCCLRVYEKDGGDLMPRDFLFELMEKEVVEEERRRLYDLEYCTFCNQHEKASCWCKDCKEFLCSFCQEYHKHIVKTCRHVIEDKACGELRNTLPNLKDNKCKLHDNQPFTMYCKSCEALICSLEKHKEHNDEEIHKVETIQEIVENYRDSLEDKLREVKNVANVTEGAKAFLNKKREALTTKRDEYFDKIKQGLLEIFKELIHLDIDIRKKAMIESVRSSKIIKGKEIENKNLSCQALQFYKYGNILLEQGNLWSLFRHIFETDTQYNKIIDEYNNLSNQVNHDDDNDEKSSDLDLFESTSKEILSRIKGLSSIFQQENSNSSMVEEDRMQIIEEVNGGAGGDIFLKENSADLCYSGFSLKLQLVKGVIEKEISQVENENMMTGSIVINVSNSGGQGHGQVTESESDNTEKSLKKRKLNNNDVNNPHQRISSRMLNKKSVQKQTTPSAPSAQTQSNSSNKRKSREVSVSDEEISHSSSKSPEKRRTCSTRVSAAAARLKLKLESSDDEDMEESKSDSDDGTTTDTICNDICFICQKKEGKLCCVVCSRSFHYACHIPPFDNAPSPGMFQCLFCTELEEVCEIHLEYDTMVKSKQLMKQNELQVCFKFLCEMYKIEEIEYIGSTFNALFLSKYEKDATHIDAIRSRLCLGIPEPFKEAKELVMMIKKSIFQAKMFYQKESDEYSVVIRLDGKFDILIGQYFPHLKDLNLKYAALDAAYLKML